MTNKKPISEKFLIKQGFKKNKISKKESGDKAFYYYTYDFNEGGDFSLITQASDEVIDGWEVHIFNTDHFTTSRKHVKNFIKAVNKFCIFVNR